MGVKEGNKIKIEYTGSLDDGTVFDSTDNHDKPLEFEVGAKQVIPGFEEAVLGMEEGEEKEVKIEPDKAYGQPQDDLIKKVPKDKLPKDQELKAGMMLAIGLPTGQQIPAKVLKIDEKEATIDLNHPLSGKVLNFKIKLVGIGAEEEKKEEPATEEEAKEK